MPQPKVIRKVKKVNVRVMVNVGNAASSAILAGNARCIGKALAKARNRTWRL